MKNLPKYCLTNENVNVNEVNVEALAKNLRSGNVNISQNLNLPLKPRPAPSPSPQPNTVEEKININLDEAVRYNTTTSPITSTSGEERVLTSNQAQNWVNQVAKANAERKKRVQQMRVEKPMFIQPRLTKIKGGKKTHKNRKNRKH